MFAPIDVAADTEILVTPLIAELMVAAPVMLYAPIPEIAALLVVVAAVLLTSPNARVPPTIPAKLTAPLPTLSVKFLAVVELFNVELNVILLFVVLSVVAAPSVIAFP